MNCGAAGTDMMQKSACMSTGVACWQGDCQRSPWDLASVPRTLTSDPLAFTTSWCSSTASCGHNWQMTHLPGLQADTLQLQPQLMTRCFCCTRCCTLSGILSKLCIRPKWLVMWLLFHTDPACFKSSGTFKLLSANWNCHASSGINFSPSQRTCLKTSGLMQIERAP